MTLRDVLDRVATRFPDRGFHFPALESSLDYGTLAVRASCFARGLRRSGVERGQIAALVFPTGPEFLVALFGVAAAGAACSPLPWPAMGDLQVHCERVLQRLRAGRSAAFVLTHPSLESSMAAALAAVQDREGPRLLRFDEVAAGGGPHEPNVGPDDLAIVQYTSGSTSAPTGVALRHRQVISGLRAICHGIELGPEDVNGQWLPLHHDMGLVGMLAGLACGVQHHIWPPFSFIRSPAHWLGEFARRKGSIYAGPNFSYRQMLTRITEAQVAALDLSCWRVAFNGGEPIDARCLEAFVDRFQPVGFRPETMFPVYGLAEITLAATFPSIGEPITIHSVDGHALANHKKVIHVPRERADARHVVSVGRPVRDHELRITDDRGQVLPPEHGGHIELRGPAVMDSYIGRTRAESGISADGWLRTGDLGYCSGGRLFICGRDKEMIIVRGVNYYPQDIEQLIADVPGVYRSRCVAFCVKQNDDERMVVLVEAKRAAAEQLEQLAETLRRRISAGLDLVEVDIYIVETNAIEYTTSGKSRRLRMRELLITGQLDSKILFTSTSATR